jgi:hypothetical protein
MTGLPGFGKRRFDQSAADALAAKRFRDFGLTQGALGFGRRGRKRPVLDDVVVYGFKCLGQWGELLFGQAFEEQVSDQVDVARSGFDNRSPTPGSQPNLGRPPIRCSEVALDHSPALHSLGVVRQAAPLPTDPGRQGADLHALVGCCGQGVEDVVVGKR